MSKLFKKARRDLGFRYGRRLRQLGALAGCARRDDDHLLAAPAAGRQGAQFRRPCRPPHRTAGRAPPCRHQQSAPGLSRERATPRSKPSPPTCGATWPALPPNTSSSMPFSTTIRKPRNAGRVEVGGVDHFEQIAGEDKPHILFTGHLGNFELLPVAAATFGMKITALFRPPNNPYLADYILSTRRSTMGALLPSATGASFALAAILEKGGNIGVLVDQKFSSGTRDDLLRPPMPEQSGSGHPRPALRLRCLSGALRAAAGQPFPARDRGQADPAAQ